MKKRDSIFQRLQTLDLVGVDDGVVLGGRFAWEAFARVLGTVGGVAQALSG